MAKRRYLQLPLFPDDLPSLPAPEKKKKIKKLSDGERRKIAKLKTQKANNEKFKEGNKKEG